MLLFAGDFDFMEVYGDYIINATVEPATARKIIANVAEIKEVYQQMMQVAFTDNIYLINHQPVKEMGPNQKWGFNVYPAFAFAGYEFENLLY